MFDTRPTRKKKSTNVYCFAGRTYICPYPRIHLRDIECVFRQFTNLIETDGKAGWRWRFPVTTMPPRRCSRYYMGTLLAHRGRVGIWSLQICGVRVKPADEIRTAPAGIQHTQARPEPHPTLWVPIIFYIIFCIRFRWHTHRQLRTRDRQVFKSTPKVGHHVSCTAETTSRKDIDSSRAQLW